jgi:glycosyltransferase involved in cell wall biosynthesis
MSRANQPSSPPLSVAQVVETLTMGGAENLAVRIANACARAGDDSHLYVLSGSDLLAAKVDPAVKVHDLDLPWPRGGNSFRMLSVLLRRYRRLALRVRRDGVRIVQTHLPAANYLGLLLAWRRVCAVVATLHSTQEFRHQGKPSFWRRLWRRRAYRFLLRRCSATVAVSAEVGRAVLDSIGLAEADAPRLVTITSGVAIPAPPVPSARAAVRDRHGLTADEPLLLAAGRLVELKDYRTLIAAVGCLLADRRPCRLIIAGEGPLRAELLRQVREENLTGHIDLPGNVLDLTDLMLAADIFVMTSLWEGLPLSLLEAMACGLPVVGTNVSGIAGVVRDGISGLLTPPRQPEALAAAIASLMADPRRRQQMGSAGRADIAARYDFEAFRRRLRTLYRGVAGA